MHAFPNKEPRRILIVDDEPEVLELLKEMVARFGYEVEGAGGGREALHKIDAGYYDLVITDIQMPDLGGLDLIERVKRFHPEIDVIAVTGFKEYRYTEIINKGASDFLTKPVDAEELHAKILRIFKDRDVWAVFQRLTDRDALTDLYNRRRFDRYGLEAVARALRQKAPLSLILMGLGGPAGGESEIRNETLEVGLCELAELVRISIRTEVDFCFRHSGNVVGILAPDATESQARIIAERIRAKYLRKSTSRLFFGFGVAALDESLVEPERAFRLLVEQAEASLEQNAHG